MDGNILIIEPAHIRVIICHSKRPQKIFQNPDYLLRLVPVRL
jgi:hypothetical protein